LNIKFDLSLRCADATIASELSKVMLPDNRNVPKDQRFTMALEGSTLKFRIVSPRLMPGLSTLESILSDASLFDEISQSSI
jgi:hypothetical protein